MSTLSSVQENFNFNTADSSNVLLSFLSNKYSHLYTAFASNYSISGKSLFYSVFAVLTTYILFEHFTRKEKTKKGPSTIQNIMNKFSDALSLPSMFMQGNSNNSGYGGGDSRYGFQSSPEFKKLYKRAIKNGGFPGGLANDGNTCFMNSVIQCLASSDELKAFLSAFASEKSAEEEQSSETVENQEENANTVSNDKTLNSGKTRKLNNFFKSLKSDSNLSANDRLKPVQFSAALLELIESLNSQHGNRAPTYKTKELLRVMKDSPNKHLFLGYNQEDAQEFYQNVMKQVEKEFTDLEKMQSIEVVVGEQDNESENSGVNENCEEKNEKNEKKISEDYVTLPENAITGLESLGYLGNVYVPVSQIDPADSENEDKYLPYRLITPVDGLQCDRIGCVNCGEMGGIRYSVTSGLALNLPMDGATRNRFTLGELINEFCKPDVIDGVECNRCSLVAVKENLSERLENLDQNDTGGAGSKLLREKIESRLAEIEEVLSKKCIHDDVYNKLHTKNMVRKSRKVKQSYLSRPPALLCIHVNRSVFDPRTYMVRKNNAKIDFPLELDMSDFVASVDDINSDARLEFRKQDEEAKKLDRGDTLKYKLKSVISHFGTHNYGHYIAFRKHRGNWWHISDEIVRLSTQEEVLGSQGTFMLFYEISDDYSDSEYSDSSSSSDKSDDEMIEKNEQDDDDSSLSENGRMDKVLNSEEFHDNRDDTVQANDEDESQIHIINNQANL